MTVATGTKLPRVMIVSPKYSSEVFYESNYTLEEGENNDAYPPDKHVQVVHKLGSRSSLLTWTFNMLLAEALNRRDAGDVDYLAMHHSDIGASKGWINELYGRMKERGDVLISAVVPMKDHERIRTSTAVGVRDEPFNFRRYITMSDQPGMPTTFGTEDVAKSDDEILLVNTGLWLADLSWPGWDSFRFHILNEIQVNPETGNRQAWVVSEDWYLSHYLDSLAAPYSATWIPLRHIGIDYWDSCELPPIYPKFVPDDSSKVNKGKSQ